MLSPRSPLSVKNENTLSSQMDDMSLDKENTVRTKLRSDAASGTPNVEPCAPSFPVQCKEVKAVAAISA